MNLHNSDYTVVANLGFYLVATVYVFTYLSMVSVNIEFYVENICLFIIR